MILRLEYIRAEGEKERGKGDYLYLILSSHHRAEYRKENGLLTLVAVALLRNAL